MSNRMARVDRLLLATLAELVPRAIRDPRVSEVDLLVVSGVRTTPDLRHAKVYVSVVGEQDERHAAIEALQHARGYLRREIGKRVRLRNTPELRFALDDTAASATRVEQVLREVVSPRDPRVGEQRRATAEEAHAALSDADRVLVTTHPDPDGDAIGSALAAAYGLQQLGKQVVLYNPDPVPTRCAFLRGSDRFVRELPEGPFDATLIVDCSDDRMFPEGPPPREQLGRVVVLDHHKTIGEFGDLIHSDPSAAAAGVVVYRWLRLAAVEMDHECEEAIYCALMSDTGSFRYQNTNPEAMRVAAELLERGVDCWRVASQLYESRPRGELDLLVRVLQTLRTSPDGLSAALRVTPQMLEASGCTSDAVDGLINYARGLRGVEVAILLRVEQDRIRGSLRSRGQVDVSQIAERFGGGGHHNAAGFRSELEPDALLAQLFDVVAEHCARLPQA